MLTELVGAGCMSFHSSDPRIRLLSVIAVEAPHPPI